MPPRILYAGIPLMLKKSGLQLDAIERPRTALDPRAREGDYVISILETKVHLTGEA